MNPQSARAHFRSRWYRNAAIVAAIFIPVVILSQMTGGWWLTLLAIGILYFVFFHVLSDTVLSDTVIGIECPGCKKHIATNTPWVCGVCRKKNTRTDDFPFIHRCEHQDCGAEPKAYKCHHKDCDKLIFLTEDHQEENYAYCLIAPAPDKLKAEITSQERAKRKLEHRLIATRLTAEWKEAKAAMTPPKEKAPHEVVEESFSRHNTFTMSAYDIARREKKANAVKYKDDPEMLERANESVDAWLRDRL